MQPGPDMRIYLFQYLQVTKKIASNYLWLQCTVCVDYKQATRTLRKHSNFKKFLKVCAWKDQPASRQPGPDMQIDFFQYLLVMKT